jgi:hypothetical protein
MKTWEDILRVANGKLPGRALIRRDKSGFQQLPMWDPTEEQFQDGTQTGRPRQILALPGSKTYFAADVEATTFYDTMIDSTVRDIMVEIAQEREYGLVRPFVEGEPIGMIQKPKPFNPPVETRAQRYERKQQELRTLRASNDAAINRILGE